MMREKKFVEKLLELVNKMTESQQSSHRNEGGENVEALEEKKEDLTMRREKGVSKTTGRMRRRVRVKKNRLSTLMTKDKQSGRTDTMMPRLSHAKYFESCR